MIIQTLMSIYVILHYLITLLYLITANFAYNYKMRLSVLFSQI